MHRRGMMGCAGVVVCFLVLAAGISAENKQEKEDKPWFFEKALTVAKGGGFKKFTTVTLAKKEWKPNLTKMPNNDEILDRYPGSVDDARNTFMDPENWFESHEKQLEDFHDLLTGDYGYDPNKESIFVFRVAGPKVGSYLKNMVLALAMRNLYKEYNLFTIGIDDYALMIISAILQESFGSQAKFKEVSSAVGDYFNSAIEKGLIRGNQIHLIGFCWAGRMSGWIAKYIKETNKQNQRIKSVLALDPFSIGKASLDPQILKADHADVVQVYHTNELMMGSFYQTANLNIVFNTGLWQPGCETRGLACSHSRAPELVWYVILYPDLFVARKCDIWSDFEECKCDNADTIGLTYPPQRPELKKMGVYYIKTLPKKPFGYGPEGANGCSAKEDEEIDSDTQLNDAPLQ